LGQAKDYYKLIALSAVGSCFELFDFLSFIFLSSILSRVFFPFHDKSQGLIYTFIIFSTGYFFRPVGGILLAHFGDRYGRKLIFILTLLLMSLPSLIIALMPVTRQIGIAAPILLALMRMTQGISLGGEVAGSVTYVAEFTSERWRTFACSLMTASANAGVLLVALVVSVLTNALSAEQMTAFGWRIPFLTGAALGLTAVYLRKRFSETPLFLEIQNKHHIQKVPLAYVWKHYRPSLLFGFSLAIIVSSSTSTFHLFFPSYLTDFLNFKMRDVVLVSSAGIAALAIFSPLFALASMYIGRQRQCMAGASLLIMLCAAAAYNNYGTGTLVDAYIFIVLVSLAIALVNSVMMAMLADLFPTCVRFTGVALSYNLGCLVGAGLTPMINTYCIHATGYLNTPFALVAIFAALASLAMVFHAKAA